MYTGARIARHLNTGCKIYMVYVDIYIYIYIYIYTYIHIIYTFIYVIPCFSEKPLIDT